MHSGHLGTLEVDRPGAEGVCRRGQIQELRSLRFIHEASNVVFLGPPGVGRMHLSVALGGGRDPGWFRCLVHDGPRSGHRS